MKKILETVDAIIADNDETIGTLKSTIVSMDTEITRLQDIVDKLPKTADGVVVVPGMKLFVNSIWHKTRSITVWGIGDCGGDDHYRHHTFVFDSGGLGSLCNTMDMEQFFSTREAAEAALKEQAQ